MASRKGAARVVAIDSGTSPKTILQLVAPANQTINLVELSVGGHGQSNTAEPLEVELVRQTSAGTMGANTPNPLDDGWGGTLQTTAQQDASAEPTGTVVIRTYTMHPQTGLAIQFERDEILVDGGGRLGLRVNAASAVDIDATLVFVE